MSAPPPWTKGDPIVVFGDDWGRYVSTMQHLFRHISLDYPVVWVNAIGHRPPSLSLADARRAVEKVKAMARQREAQPVFGLAWAGNIAFNAGRSRYFNARNLLALGLLLLSLIGVTYWQVTTQANDIADIDASLLTGDLPINAYLDSDFEAWLKRSLH